MSQPLSRVRLRPPKFASALTGSPRPSCPLGGAQGGARALVWRLLALRVTTVCVSDAGSRVFCGLCDTVADAPVSSLAGVSLGA